MHTKAHTPSHQLHRAHRTRQSGAVLAVSLIILLLLTLIGITAMRVTTMEEKMAGNTRNRNLAFQAAESALRDGEAYVESLTTTSGFTGAGGLYSETDAEPDYTNTASWSATTSRAYSSTFPGVSSAPRYYIKILAVVAAPTTSKVLPSTTGAAVTIFRITARGVGANPNAEVVLQSRYGKTF